MIAYDEVLGAPNGFDPEPARGGNFVSLDPGTPKGNVGSAHSAYLTDGSTAQAKLADIVSGKQLKE